MYFSVYKLKYVSTVFSVSQSLACLVGDLNLFYSGEAS
jgi:hypothetical protein